MHIEEFTINRDDLDRSSVVVTFYGVMAYAEMLANPTNTLGMTFQRFLWPRVEQLLAEEGIVGPVRYEDLQTEPTARVGSSYRFFVSMVVRFKPKQQRIIRTNADWNF